jgi:hypothetical protein
MTKTHSRSRCDYPLLEPLQALDCAPQQGGTPPTVFLGRFLPKLGGAFRCRLFLAWRQPERSLFRKRRVARLPGIFRAGWDAGCALSRRRAYPSTFPLVHPGRSQSDATGGQPAPTTGRPSSCPRLRWPDCGTSSRGAFSCEKGVDGGALGRHKPPPAARWSTSSRPAETLWRPWQGKVGRTILWWVRLHAFGMGLLSCSDVGCSSVGLASCCGMAGRIPGHGSLTIASVFWKQAHAVVVSCASDPVIRVWLQGQ